MSRRPTIPGTVCIVVVLIPDAFPGLVGGIVAVCILVAASYCAVQAARVRRRLPRRLLRLGVPTGLLRDSLNEMRVSEFRAGEYIHLSRAARPRFGRWAARWLPVGVGIVVAGMSYWEFGKDREEGIVTIVTALFTTAIIAIWWCHLRHIDIADVTIDRARQQVEVMRGDRHESIPFGQFRTVLMTETNPGGEGSDLRGWEVALDRGAIRLEIPVGNTESKDPLVAFDAAAPLANAISGVIGLPVRIKMSMTWGWSDLEKI